VRSPLDEVLVEAILRGISNLTIVVLGDLFLDRYLDLDAALTETSLETGLDAYQVVRVRACPGASGTVINNLAALGVERICPIAVIGDDGEGYELRQALAALPAVDPAGIVVTAERRTPTYTKPLLHERGALPRELNRLDIKNRLPLPRALEDRILEALEQLWPRADAVVVLDQVSEPDCGVVTSRVRRRLAELGERDPDKFVLADSRERIGLFPAVSLKPNTKECLEAAFGADAGLERLPEAVCRLAAQAGRPVFCTAGEKGILVARSPKESESSWVPGYPVSGPIDVVGAGDSTSAAIVCAIAAGTGPAAAAAFGNLVASITIQQIGTTGTASPAQVRQRWREVCGTA
jgi:bifunctional ADP-heptose synthase (sugar kinase/adenylyltransferase)